MSVEREEESKSKNEETSSDPPPASGPSSPSPAANNTTHSSTNVVVYGHLGVEKHILKKAQAKQALINEREERKWLDLNERLGEVTELKDDIARRREDLEQAKQSMKGGDSNSTQKRKESSASTAEPDEEDIASMERGIAATEKDLQAAQLRLTMAREHWKRHLATDEVTFTASEKRALKGAQVPKEALRNQQYDEEEERARERAVRRHAYADTLTRVHRTQLPQLDPSESKLSLSSSYSRRKSKQETLLLRRQDAANRMRSPPHAVTSGIAGFGDGTTRKEDISALVRDSHRMAMASSAAGGGVTSPTASYSSMMLPFDAATMEAGAHCLYLNEQAVLCLGALKQRQAMEYLRKAEELTRGPTVAKTATTSKAEKTETSSTTAEEKRGETPLPEDASSTKTSDEKEEDPDEVFFGGGEQQRLELRAVTLNNMACLHKQAHHVVEALRMIEQCMAVEEQLGVQSGRTLLNLSNLLRMAGRPEEALLASRKAVQLLARDGSLVQNETELFLMEDDPEASLQLYENRFSLNDVALETLQSSHKASKKRWQKEEHQLQLQQSRVQSVSDPGLVGEDQHSTIRRSNSSLMMSSST